MKNIVIINCESCNSFKIELVYQYTSHLHAIPISWTRCADCKYPSDAINYLSYSSTLDNYIEVYSKKYQINCSPNDFKNRIVECIKRQIIQSCLLDEKNNILGCQDGYYNFHCVT